MKILKLIKQRHNHYFAVFDEIPEITYEKVGCDFVGSATDSNDNIVASNFLKREPYGDAFGGRELKLKMKDGSIESIKDYWFDHGSYKPHGEFVGIGAGTLEKLQDCYVYFNYNINKNTFEKMVEEYLSRDRLYEYREVEEWCKLQYQWFNVFVHGKKIPYMMNKKGEMVEKESKKRVYSRHNVVRKVNGEYKTYVYFKFEYKDGNNPIRLEANYMDVLRDTLPFDEETIKKNCKID